MSANDVETLACTCKEIRELCDDLVTETFQRLELCPVLTLPNIAIDIGYCDEIVDNYFELFQKGARIVFKDIGQSSPQEIQKTVKLVTEAEKRLNEEINRESTTSLNESLNGSRPMSRDTETSRIIETFKFTQKIAMIFKFHGKCLKVGRMYKNRSVELKQGQLIVVTLDDRYQFCSTSDVIFVTNLCHKKLEPGQVIQIGENIKLEILKQIDKHFTCCVEEGGTVESFAEVFIYDDNEAKCQFASCLTETDQQNCKIAVKLKATGIILPYPHSACYVSQIRWYLCQLDQNCRINILLEFDEEQYIETEHQRQILKSIQISNGIYMKKPFMEIQDDDAILPLLHNKIIISKYIPSLPPECYSGINSFLPTCFLLSRDDTGIKDQIELLSKSIKNNFFPTIPCDSLLETKALISISSTGDKAIGLSRARLSYPIIAITDNESTTKELHLFRGIKAIFYDWKHLKDRSDKSTLKYLLRLSVAYARHLCLLHEKFCIKYYELMTSSS